MGMPAEQTRRWSAGEVRELIAEQRGVTEPFVLELDAFFSRIFLENEPD